MKKINRKIPFLIPGGISTDKRGRVGFVNTFGFEKVKRFYTVENEKAGQFRGWHAHKRESKFVFPVAGRAIIAAVKIDNWNNPSKEQKVKKFKVSSQQPCIIYIPPGYANGFKNLTKNTKLIFYSTSSLEQSKNDDKRFPEEYWTL